MIYSKYFTIILISILILSSANYVNAEQKTPTPPSNIVYVSPDGNDTQDGLTSETSKKTICNAVESAQHNDTIQIAPGTYKENIIINKNIKLVAKDPNNTTINGNKKKTCITIKKEYNVFLKGFTITKGYPQWHGGGIYNEGNLTIQNTTITKNSAIYGGGIANYGNLTLDNSLISDNYIGGSHAGEGAGIYNIKGNIYIKNTIITKNEADGHSDYSGGDSNSGTYEPSDGGGISNNRGNITIINSSITDNKADNGGSMRNYRGSVFFENSSITENWAAYGGGLSASYSKISFKNCIISENCALNGGGISSYKSIVYLFNSSITENHADRTGGGVYYKGKDPFLDGSSKIINNTASWWSPNINKAWWY